jgi:hypothetical protein
MRFGRRTIGFGDASGQGSSLSRVPALREVRPPLVEAARGK